jgi:hypothetical protein
MTKVKKLFSPFEKGYVPLSDVDFNTLYSAGEAGYTDYLLYNLK